MPDQYGLQPSRPDAAAPATPAPAAPPDEDPKVDLREYRLLMQRFAMECQGRLECRGELVMAEWGERVITYGFQNGSRVVVPNPNWRD